VKHIWKAQWMMNTPVLGWRKYNLVLVFDIYTSRPFQWYKEHLKARCFAFCCRALKLRESRRTPNSHFWECESHPHTCLKVGLRQMTYRTSKFLSRNWSKKRSVDIRSIATPWLQNAISSEGDQILCIPKKRGYPCFPTS